MKVRTETAILIMLGLIAGNFLYQWVHAADWPKAFDESVATLITFGCLFIASKWEARTS